MVDRTDPVIEVGPVDPLDGYPALCTQRHDLLQSLVGSCVVRKPDAMNMSMPSERLPDGVAPVEQLDTRAVAV